MRTALYVSVPLICICNHTVHDLHRINNTDVAQEQMNSISTVLASYTEAIPEWVLGARIYHRFRRLRGLSIYLPSLMRHALPCFWPHYCPLVETLAYSIS